MKGTRMDLSASPCAIARTLDVIGDWWSLLIIREAMAGVCRFGVFQKNLGLAKNILASRLRKLVDAGILDIAPGSDGSPYSGYRISGKGEQLYLVLAALWQWGERYAFAPQELTLQLVDRETRQPIAPLDLRSQDGRRLGPRDIVQITAPS